MTAGVAACAAAVAVSSFMTSVCNVIPAALLVPGSLAVDVAR